MSESPAGSGFSARLQEALNKARSDAPPVTEPTRSTSAAPTAQADAARDEFNTRVTQALQQARGEAPADRDDDDEPTGIGPVGTGDYVVRDGDCMASIAVDHGHFWETLWNDPGNSELQQVRKDPYVLLPDDRVTIPDKRRRDEQIAPEKRHRFKRKGCPEQLKIRLLVNDQPRANEAYVLTIDGESSEGVTDPDGKIEVFIPSDAREGELLLTESGDKYTLRLGGMDPITEISGVQGRLQNLGFFHGPVDGNLSEEFEQAVLDFQEAHHLPPTGSLDDPTRSKIQEAHAG